MDLGRLRERLLEAKITAVQAKTAETLARTERNMAHAELLRAQAKDIETNHKI